MELIKESDFRREIKATPRVGYLFFGEEDYLKAHALRLAREQLCPDLTFEFFNVMKLDALDFTPSKLLDALMPLPMAAEKKLVTLTGLNLNQLRPSELEALCDALAQLKDYDYNVFILSASADCLDPGSAFPKRPSALLSALAEHLTPVYFERTTPARLAAWIQKHFEHHGVEASPQLCSRMVDYCGRSMHRLANEIDKLCFYVLQHGRHTATEDELTLVCTPSSELDAFALANALMDGRSDAALSILGEYRFRRTEPLLVLGEVIRVFSEMETTRLMLADGASPQEIGSVLKAHEFRVKLYQKCLLRTPEQRLRRALEACLSADASMKNASIDGYTRLELLICSI